MIYLDQRKNWMTSAVTGSCSLKTGRCWIWRIGVGVLGVFCSLQYCTISAIMEGKVITGQSLRQWQKIRFSWVADFFETLPSLHCINQKVLSRVSSWLFHNLCWGEWAFGWTERQVLLTVFFLCIKWYVGNIAHLKHPRFIQSLDASGVGLWPDKCLQSENYISIYLVFVFKKWNFDFQFPSFWRHVAGVFLLQTFF